MFRGMRVCVAGLGVSGAAAARTLREAGAEVWVSEQREVPVPPDLRGLRVELGGHRPEHLDGAEVLVVSPGIPEGAPIVAWARERSVRVWSELELGARLARVPYLAVTGTNGKTTTAELLTACLRAAGLDAVACGNIGHPFCLAAQESHEALVVEASSFQLRFQESFHPRVSVLLNLAPDHLDWHGSMESYVAAKAKVFEHQVDSGDVHVGNREDPLAADVSKTAPCRVCWFGLGRPPEGDVGYDGETLVVGAGDSPRSLATLADRPASFRADAAAAAAVALAYGVSAEAVAAALQRAAPLPHRGEVVAVRNGVRFVDDSKATNPHAALASLEGRERVVLIAGGLAKGLDLSPLLRAQSKLVGVIAIGQAAPEIERCFSGILPVSRAKSIEEAVRIGYALAPKGGTVLLAPACASQDMFRDYAERGDRFAAAARAMTG